MKPNLLRFFAPEGNVGGPGNPGVAIGDGPQKTGAEGLPELESAGEIYKRAMKQEQAQPEPERAEPEEKAAEPAKSKKEEPKPEPKKPTSALDAVLETETPTEPEATASKETEPTDYLKDIPETISPDKTKRADDWKKARGVIEHLSGLISTNQKRMSELEEQAKTATAPSAELLAENEKLKKENQEYKDSMVALNIEFDPEWRKKFVDGRNILVKKASDKLDAFIPGKGADLAKALAMPEGRARTTAIAEALADLEEGERFRVREFISQVERLDDEKEEQKKNPQTAWEQLKATDEAKRKEAEKEAANYKQKVYDETKGQIAKKLFLLRQVDGEIEGSKEHNQRVETITKEAWRLLGSITPHEACENAFRAASASHYQALLIGTRKELKEALARLSEYESAEPGFRGDKQPTKSDIETNLEKSPGQIYEESMRAQRGD